MALRGGSIGAPSGAAAGEDVADVTHSTAFVVLNALVDEGQISEERADYLKQRFKDLHSRVLSIYKRDNALLKRARQLRSRLETERQRVYMCGDAAKKDDEVIQALKRHLMEQERDLAAALERESVLHVEVLEYDRRKQHLILEREDAIASEEARLRPQMEAMQTEITAMGTHIKELAAELDRSQADQEELNKEEAQKEEEISNFTVTLSQARQQLMNVQNDPERARKQLEMVQNTLSGAQRELNGTEDKIAAQAERIQALELQRNSRAEDYEAAKKRAQTMRSEIEAKRKTLATMSTSLEVELETRQGTQERVGELVQLILASKIAVQQEQDGVERIERERDKCMRLFSSCEQAKDDARREEEFLHEQVRLVRKEQEQVKRAAAQVEKEIQAFRKDAEVRAKKLLVEQAKSKDFVKMADRVLADIREVEETIAVKTRQDDVKQRELAAVAVKRQELSRASARESTRATLAQRELQVREVYLREAQRRHGEMERRLSKVVDLFQKVKQERAQKVTQIQTVAQVMAQVAEKTKLLEKELAVLTRESALKDQEINKAKFQVHELTQHCANLRLEKNRQRKCMERAADSEREVKAQVRRLNTDIAASEDTMADLRHGYATAVESRNQTGIRLIDRNDEAALLVARVKAQEAAIAEGTRMTNERADQLRLLKTKLAGVLHDIEACQQSIPKVSQMELELTRVRDEIEAEQWRTQVLEEDLTDPKNHHRWNRIPLVLPEGVSIPAIGDAPASAPAAGASSLLTADGNGNDAAAVPTLVGGPTEEFVQLQARCQELEARVQSINAKLREKDLILEEVTELAERVGGQADAGKECTLALAKQVNKYHSSIRNKSRQMMATISELSLFQASSIQLQQEVQRLEAVVEAAEERLEAGEAPYAEAAIQYEREQQSERRYAAARQRQRGLAQESEAALGKQLVATTAPPRPNAYVSENENLGLPRPYGPFAPFKPSVPQRTAGGHATLQPSARDEAWSSSSVNADSTAPSRAVMGAVRGATVPLSANPSPPGTSSGLPSKHRVAGTPPPPPMLSSRLAAPAVVERSPFSSSVPTRLQSGDPSAVRERPSVVAADSVEQLRVSQRANSSTTGVAGL